MLLHKFILPALVCLSSSIFAQTVQYDQGQITNLGDAKFVRVVEESELNKSPWSFQTILIKLPGANSKV